MPAPVPVPAPVPLRALDPPTVPIAIAGTLTWGVVGLVLLASRDRLAAHGHASWLQICLAGFLIGLFGTGLMLLREAGRRRRVRGVEAVTRNEPSPRDG